MESPQEDEFGLVNLCGLSPYLGAIFARSERAMQEKGYIKYLSFKVRVRACVCEMNHACVCVCRTPLQVQPVWSSVLGAPPHACV